MKKKLLTALFAIILMFSTSATTFAANDFTPKTIKSESQATYEIDLKMEKSGAFQIVSKAKVKNLSKQEWSYIPFYFIPNIFSKENHPISRAGDISKLAVKVNKKTVKHNVVREQLQVNYKESLKKSLKPNETAEIEISYTLKLPNSAFRLLQSDKNYYMAQWYPMLPTYYNGNWNIRPYYELGESYHTTHTSFKLNYSLLDGYKLASSSEKDSSKSKGTVSGSNIKEIYVAVLNKDNLMKSKKVNDTEIRVFGNKNKPELVDFALTLGSEAFDYYEKNVGDYPMKQLDIVLTENFGTGHMEYPGIVTVITDAFDKNAPIEEVKRGMEVPLAHEIGHQWFYGVVNNDPYVDAWLDEGMNSLITELFFYNKTKRSYALMNDPWIAKQYGVKKPSNLESTWYSSVDYHAFIYDQPAFRMWSLFSKYGGYEKGIDFLKDYYKTFAYKQLDTEEFVRYTMNYFDMKDDLFFREWLKLKGYYDVPKDHYAFEAVNMLKEYGFGAEMADENGAFHPFDDITRYDAARYLAGTKGLENPQDELLNFTDLDKNDPAYKSISGLVKEGYFKTESQFYPKDALTNEQLSYFLVNAVNKDVVPIKPEQRTSDHWITKYIEFDENKQPKIKTFSQVENIDRIDYAYIIAIILEAEMMKWNQ